MTFSYFVLISEGLVVSSVSSHSIAVIVQDISLPSLILLVVCLQLSITSLGLFLFALASASELEATRLGALFASTLPKLQI